MFQVSCLVSQYSLLIFFLVVSPQVNSLGNVLISTLPFQSHNITSSSPLTSTYASSTIFSLFPPSMVLRSIALSLLWLIIVILFCLTNKSLHKLQVLQNPAAWIITCTCSPAASLAARRLTRIIVSDLCNNLAPAYMSDLLHTAAPLGLHSAVTSCSLCPSHHYGNRAFSCSAHRNSLPPDIRNAGSLPLFKSKPQIHLFNWLAL